jgi:DNA-binding NtrC family response regulator
MRGGSQEAFRLEHYKLKYPELTPPGPERQMSMRTDEDMRTDELQLLEVLDFEPEEGVIRFHEQRMVIQGAAAMGLLRRELIHTLGGATARRLLLRFGYADGYHDAVSLRDHVGWADPIEGLRAGLKLHMLEGIVCALPQRLEYDRRTHAFEAQLTWRNSYEAEQHLYRHGRSDEPVCWTLVGYISGFASACFGEDVYFRESQCAGQGEAVCTLVGRHAAGWGPGLPVLHADFRGADLRGEIEGLRQAVARQRHELTRRQRSLARREREVEALREAALRHATSRRFIAHSRAMRDVLEMTLRVAPLDTTILISGESGTGKEFLARMLHEQSRRAARTLVTVNCAALTETLLESELFGHVRGAFTGASRDKIGLFEQAGGSTLLLDEVGEMSPALQVKLLRALQEREIRRVGGERTIQVDVRVVAATNRDLRAEAAAGRFREDLYFRLAGFEIQVPPLRERREEIPVLANALLRRSARRNGKNVRAISAEAVARLVNYRWPGNVRELEHAVERAVILARGSTVTMRDLPPEIRESAAPLPARAALNLKRHEERLIREALSRFEGNRRKAAEALGISTVSLWRKIKEYRIAPSVSQ